MYFQRTYWQELVVTAVVVLVLMVALRTCG